MPEFEAASAAQILLKAGLVTETDLLRAWELLGTKDCTGEQLLNALERLGLLTPWQTSKVLKGDTEGFVLGGYRLLYKIQSGSFGRVFRAEEEGSGRVVAIKVLRRRWSEDQQRIDLFTREGRVGMSLTHPNIVEVLSTNVERKTGQYYIVMEFVEGLNLRELLMIRKKLEPIEALKIVEDCANGLAYAYSRGITHRDVKPTNILIASQGMAKLVDFGLAKIYSSLAGQDEDKVERTVDYAGLERGTGVKSGDVRSDIYFLGCVLYEMLAGRPPLEMTRDKHARMHKHRFDSVKPLDRSEVDAPTSLFHLVETMMELNPARRYQTPAQLLDAVRSVRRELEGKAAGGKSSVPRGIFVVELDEGLQNAIREKFKELGYRVFIAGDPVRALERFRQQPFDGLVVDAGTTGEDGLLVFERVVAEADRQGIPCGGILLLNAEQSDWSVRVKSRPTTCVLVRPVKMKQLLQKIQELVPLNGEPQGQ
jgi:CheY-like chemotaxis protein/predicted Ser/Thr protein kinase